MAGQTADERRRFKELDEARKAGLAPAELDEDGREINPHIPQYMTSAPWYLNKDKPTLQHQRNWNKKDQDEMRWYDRGAKVFQATKWRKGACENCGSMSHKTKDCLERPRAKGAKHTNKNIAADDKIEDLVLTDFDAKRDRWNGFQPDDYAEVVDKYEKVEAMRKEAKQREAAQQIYSNQAAAAADSAALAAGGVEDEDDVKLAAEEQAGFAEVTKRVRTTAGGSTGSVRNLRIREDTAKYLLNLDLDSAYYDPKTRSMREDPQPHKPMNEKTFFGDNFVRKSGDYAAWQALEVHALQAADKGLELNVMANPSLAEKLYEQFKAKKSSLASATKEDIMGKYGSCAGPLPDDVRALAGTEKYVEYDRLGRVVKGQENKARSRYEEDVLINNHTSVWGSWWKDGTWGYACCHQTLRNSYCTGKAGEVAQAEVAAQMVANMQAKAREAEAEAQRRREASALQGTAPPVDVWGTETADVELDEAKVKAALAKMEREEAAAAAEGHAGDKRKYNSLNLGENVTPEEMEAWRIKRAREDDPVALAKARAAAEGGKAAGAGGYEYL